MKNLRQLSWWERTLFFENIDVAVVGSGIVGLNAAICLKEAAPRLRVTILERGVLPAGASTRNAGFACFGSMTELMDDLRSQTEEEVFSLLEMRWRGLQRLKERVGEQQMQYRQYGGYELFGSEEEDTFKACAEQMSRFNRILASITGQAEVYRIADDRLPDFAFSGKMTHLIRNGAEGQLHPAKMIRQLEKIARDKGVQILNGIDVTGLEAGTAGVRLETAAGWVMKAQKVLIANNGFAKDLLPSLDVRPARNQVLVSQPVPGLKVKGCFHYDRGYYYFRNAGDRILLGGARHLAPEKETTTEFGFDPLIRDALTRFLKEVILPGRPVAPEYWWSGIMGIGLRKKPIIKQVEPNVFVSVRLGGMGVAIGSLIGERAAGLILE